MSGPSVVTRGYDNDRSGRFPAAPNLDAASVAAHGVVLHGAYHLRDDKRGMDAQPLILTDVRLGLAPGGQAHDAVFCLTQAGMLEVFHAHTREALGSRLLGRPIRSSRAIDFHLTNDRIGGMSSPVADLLNRVIYLCVWTSPDYGVARARHLVFAVDIDTLELRHPPIDLGEAIAVLGPGLPQKRFDQAARKQRAALTLTDVALPDGGKHQTLFIPFGSLTESVGSSTGWLVAIDVEAWRIGAAWTATGKGKGGGIWMSGGGPVADERGDLTFITANGDWNPKTGDYSDSAVTVRYEPKARRIRFVTHWTPFTGKARLGHDAATEHESLAPTNRRPTDLNDAAMYGDMDLGVNPPMRVARYNKMIHAGKDGIYYVHEHGDFGDTTAADLKDPPRNYAKLATPPGFATYYPGPDKNPAPDDPQDLNFLFGDVMHHQHCGFVGGFFPGIGQLLYNGGENENLRVNKMHPDGRMEFLANSDEVASPDGPRPMGGMPGWFVALAGDVVWALVPLGCANTTVTEGVLRAYHATDFRTRPDGSKALRKLYDSLTPQHGPPVRFKFGKFVSPTPFRDLVIFPTFDARVLVMGSPA